MQKAKIFLTTNRIILAIKMYLTTQQLCLIPYLFIYLFIYSLVALYLFIILQVFRPICVGRTVSYADWTKQN